MLHGKGRLLIDPRCMGRPCRADQECRCSHIYCLHSEAMPVAVQMVLEGCLAQLLHGGYVGFGMACISNLLDTNLIAEGRVEGLCDVVRLPTYWCTAVLPVAFSSVKLQHVRQSSCTRRL